MTNALPDSVIRIGDALQLTAFSPLDAEAIVLAVADPEIRRWLPLPRPYPVELATEWSMTLTETIRTSGAGLVRCIRADGAMAGCIDVKRVDWRARTAELGYWVSPEYRGRGHATAAVAALGKWLLTEQSFERVELRIATENLTSAAVAARAGFSLEGTARNAGFTDTGRVSLNIWSRIIDDEAPPHPLPSAS